MCTATGRSSRSSRGPAARQEAAGKHPLLEALAERNARLIEELSALTLALGGIDERHARVVMETKRIGEEMRNSRQRMALTGPTGPSVRFSSDWRRKLPDLRLSITRRRRRGSTPSPRPCWGSSATGKRARACTTRRPYIDALAMDAGEPLLPELRDQLRGLVQQRLLLLDKATTTANAYLRALSGLNHAAGRLMATLASYGDYLDERLL